MSSQRCVLYLAIVIAIMVGFSQAYSSQERTVKFSMKLRRSLPQRNHNDWYSPHQRQRRNSDDSDSDNLRTSLIIVFTVGVTIGLLLIMTLCAVCMLHRARYGSFCCLKPKIRRYPQSLHFESDETEEDTSTDPEQPPQYDTAYLLNESPPVYQDALQDVVIAKGVNMSTISLPTYSSSQSSHSHTTVPELQQSTPDVVDQQSTVSSLTSEPATEEVTTESSSTSLTPNDDS